jgi:hypothetical protein
MTIVSRVDGFVADDTPIVETARASLNDSCDKPAIILPMRSGQSQRMLYFTHSAFEFFALSQALNKGHLDRLRYNT